MPKLNDIHVVAQADALTGAAVAVLREVAGMLERMNAGGEGGAVDLHSLPLSSADRRWLRERLGKGEVEARLSLGGESLMTEMGCPGIWWIEHRNEQGAVESEYIEVAWVPELLPAHPEDVEAGLETLKRLISELS